MSQLLKAFFSPSPLLERKGIALIRIIVGLLMIYHGQEVFNPELMKTYLEWDTFKGPQAVLLVYAGKASELVAGTLLLLGLFTRVGAVLCLGTLAYVTFFVGQGRFWYEDQHPFMFVLFGILFVFTGPGAWSLDAVLFGKQHNKMP